MKLWDFKLAPNPRRARVFIAEKGLDVPTEQVNIRAGENLAPAYRKVNPWGFVPALELDDGTVITEVPCIFRYLERLHPEPNLLGVNPIEEARVGAWERFGELHGMQAVAEFFRNSNALFEERGLPGMTGVVQLPALVERGKQRLAWFYAQLEQRLAESEYVAAPRFTAADITVMCAVEFAAAVGAPRPDSCPQIERWHALVKARPSASA